MTNWPMIEGTQHLPQNAVTVMGFYWKERDRIVYFTDVQIGNRIIWVAITKKM